MLACLAKRPEDRPQSAAELWSQLGEVPLATQWTSDRARAWFRQLRELRDQMSARLEWAKWPGALSMGMSGDYEVMRTMVSQAGVAVAFEIFVNRFVKANFRQQMGYLVKHIGLDLY